MHRRPRRVTPFKEPVFETGVAERLAQYEVLKPAVVADEPTMETELTKRAATLLAVMPRNQLRTTIEGLLSPHDPDKGREAIDALIEAAFVAEDETGHVRLRQ
jgi:hypothetical protein